MVYIYKKLIGGKAYYYLRASERKGNKVVVKDIDYLGNSISEVKKSLEKLPKYKDKIRKAYRKIHSFIESNYYLEKVTALKLKKDSFLNDKLPLVESCKLHHTSVFKKMDYSTKKEILKNFIIEFAFNTASIEGNTITLQQARNLLEEGLTPEGKTLREIYDLQNTEKAFFDILNSEEKISQEFIVKIHSTLLSNIDIRTGYRTIDVRVVRSNFDATPAQYVKTDMDLLLKWYDNNKDKLHPLVLAIIFHHKFEKIHPFMDGNGRTGRILMNYILLKNNYPPTIIHSKFREEYLEALRKADNANLNEINIKYYSDLIDFVADEMTEHYWELFL